MIAIVPLVSYLSGFLTSTLVPFITKRTNNHFLYIIGVSFVLSSSGWAYSIANPISSVGINSSQKYHVIGIAMFSGIGKGFISRGTCNDPLATLVVKPIERYCIGAGIITCIDSESDWKEHINSSICLWCNEFDR